MLDFHPDSVACTGQFSRLRSSFLLCWPLIMSHLPSDFRIAVTRTLPSACPKCLWPTFIPSAKSFVLSPTMFSWLCFCLLMVAFPPFLPISLTTVSQVLQHNHISLSDYKWIEILERGQGAWPPSSFSNRISVLLPEAWLCETYGLNYWPCFLSPLLSCC